MCVKPFHILARRRVCAQVCGNVRGQQSVGVCQNQVVHSFFSPLVPVSPYFTSLGLNTCTPTHTHTFCLLQFNIKVFLMVQAITPSSCDSSLTRTDLFFYFLGGFCQIDVKLWKETAPTVCWFPRASAQKDQWSERDGEEAKQDRSQSKGRWIEGDAGDNERSWRKPIDSDKRIEKER